LWVETFTHDGHARGISVVGPVKMCVDAATDLKNPIFNHDLALAQAKAHNCRGVRDDRYLDGTWGFGSTCDLPGGNNGTATIKGAASGDFTAHYHLRMETSVAHPAPFEAFNRRHVDEIDGTWLGPCPTGLAPGDMVLANGRKLAGGRWVDPHYGMGLRSKSPTPRDPASPAGR
jgi:hypothetical protein